MLLPEAIQYSNLDAVNLAVRENPNARVFYKPHPDVVKGYRSHKDLINQYQHVDVIISDYKLATIFACVDHVYTITSLSGFEALIHGLKVTTLGAPFYAHWGVTDTRDTLAKDRRNVTRSVDEIFACAYLLYPKYFDDITGDNITLSDVLDKIVSNTDNGKKEKIVKPQQQKIIQENERDIYIPNVIKGSMIDRYLVESAKNAKLKINYGDYRIPGDCLLVYLKGNIYQIKINPDVYITDRGAEHVIKGIIPFVVIDSDNDEALNDVLHYMMVGFYKKNSDFKSLYYHYKDSDKAELVSVTVYALKAGIYSHSVINDAIYLLSENYKNVSPGYRKVIFNKVYRVIGADGRIEPILNNIFNDKKGNEKDILLKAAAIYCEAGEYNRAINLARYIHSQDSNYLKNNRYLGLSNLLYTQNIVVSDWAKRDSELFIYLVNSQIAVENYIKENELCLVGNSPIEIGTKNGVLIDSKDKVLRFNSAITDYPHCVDYGKKTNILVTNPRYFETRRNRKQNLDCLIISDGNLYTSKNIHLKFHDLNGYADRIAFIPTEIDHSLTQLLYASPSSGLKFIYWMYKLNGSVDKENVYGFSLDDQGHGVATSYHSGNKYLDIIHDWAAEKKILNNIVNKGIQS